MTEYDEKKTDITNDDNVMKQRERESAEILRECFDAQIMKKLEENPPEIPSYEQFSDMIDRDQRKLRRRRRRIAGIAACFMVAMLVGIFACSLPGANVDADNNPKEEIATDDGVIIEDGGWGSSEYADNVWMTDDWEQVALAKEINPKLLIPEYVPQEYEFENLVIENYVKNDFLCEYVFVSNSNNEILEIEELMIDGGIDSAMIEESIEKIQCKYGIIYVQNRENGTKIAIIQIDDGITVYITGKISNENLVDIVEKLK